MRRTLDYGIGVFVARVNKWATQQRPGFVSDQVEQIRRAADGVLAASVRKLRPSGQDDRSGPASRHG